jgi:murein DD-endopeptidase MepM/ murein hydrolase activator NlpD
VYYGAVLEAEKEIPMKRLARAMRLSGLLAVGLWSNFAFCVALHAQAADAGSSPAPEVTSTPGIKNIFWQPNQLQQGSVAFFTVELNHVPVRVSGTWIGKTLTFFKSSDDPKIWYGLAGADLETQPGSYDLKVTAILASGKLLRSVKRVDLAAANFKTGQVEVPENFVEPNTVEKKEIARDQVLKKRAYGHITPRPLWSGDFIKPVDGPPTESFGESRILNEEKTSTHRGTDFEVKEGTPVLVSNSGTVVLAMDLFYEGNCVIVDHGERFFTIYMHLSKMDVRVGDRLKKGTQIGLSGATGRVTGPHMHMGVQWNGAYLDPLQLLALTLPKTAVP